MIKRNDNVYNDNNYNDKYVIMIARKKMIQWQRRLFVNDNVQKNDTKTVHKRLGVWPMKL